MERTMLYLSFIFLGLAALAGAVAFLLTVALAASVGTKLLFGIVMVVLAISMAWQLLRSID